MSKNFNINIENKDEWLTPPEIIKALGPFDMDPCAPVPEKRPWSTATKHLDKTMDGLSQMWYGRIWLNPPYGRETFKWLERLAKHKNGLALIFARTETKGFHREIWQKAKAVFFFKGRLKFYHVSGKQGDTANAPSCIVSYSQKDTEKIQAAINKKLLAGVIVKVSDVEVKREENLRLF